MNLSEARSKFIALVSHLVGLHEDAANQPPHIFTPKEMEVLVTIGLAQRWNKYPDEKPDKDGQYLVRRFGSNLYIIAEYNIPQGHEEKYDEPIMYQTFEVDWEPYDHICEIPHGSHWQAIVGPEAMK